MIGSQISHYTLVRSLGKGSFGEVFEGVGGLDPVRALQAPGEDRTELGGFDPGLDHGSLIEGEPASVEACGDIEVGELRPHGLAGIAVGLGDVTPQDTPRPDSPCLKVLGELEHPVIRGERYRPLSLTNDLVESAEQRTEGGIDLEDQVGDLVGVRPERVAHGVTPRQPQDQEVGGVVGTEAQLSDSP